MHVLTVKYGLCRLHTRIIIADTLIIVLKDINHNPLPLPNTISLEHTWDNASRTAKAFQSALRNAETKLTA